MVVITISFVLALSPPATGPAKLAYRPWIGLTPASTLVAIPSGTLPMATGKPAIASVFRVRRCGATDLSQPPTPCIGLCFITTPG